MQEDCYSETTSVHPKKGIKKSRKTWVLRDLQWLANFCPWLSAEREVSELFILTCSVVILYAISFFMCSQNVANSYIFQSTCRVYHILLFSGSKIHLF